MSSAPARPRSCSPGRSKTAPAVTVRFHDDRIEREIFLNPELAMAEGYMDGRIDFEDGSSIHDLLSLFWMQRRSCASTRSRR